MNRTPINNFTAGELTPQLQGRIDLSKFHNSCELSENFVPRPFGGMYKRTGFEMIAELKYADKVPKLIEYEFSTEMSYIICVEHQVMRFFTNQGAIVMNAAGTAPYEIAAPYIEDTLGQLRGIQSEDIMYLFHPDYPVKKLVRFSDNSWSLNDVSFIDGPFGDINIDAGCLITFSAREGMITLTSNKDIFTAEMVDGLFKVGIGCLKIISVTDARTATAFVTASIEASYTTGTFGAELLPTGAWTVVSGSVTTNTQFALTGMDSSAVVKKTISMSASKNYMMAFTITDGVSCSGTSRVNIKIVNGSNTIFEADYCFTSDSNFFYFNSASYTSADVIITSHGTDVDIDFLTIREEAPTGATTTMTWAEGAFSEKNGYPVTGAFHEERLWLGGNAAFPTTVWASVSGQYENFNTNDQETATNGMQLKLAARKFDFINWLQSKKDLWIGTRAGIWRIIPSSTNSALSPTNIKASYENQYGSADIDCTVVDNVIIYPQRSGSKIRNIEYELATDSYKGDEISIFGEHILRESPLSEWAWQQEPYGILWMVRNDGQLVGMTYMKTQDVLAWHRHPLRGTDIIESIACIPAYQKSDQLWVTTKRTINGTVKRFVERMTYETSDATQQNYLDCSLARLNEVTETSTISGLTHLAGETVAVMVDGARQTDKVVSAQGTITLDTPGYNVIVGLLYRGLIKTHRLEQAVQGVSTQGLDARIINVVVRLLASGASIKVGNALDNMDEIYVRNTQPMDAAVPLFTGDKMLPFSGSWNDDTTSFYLTHEAPFPCNLLCFIAEWETGETQ